MQPITSFNSNLGTAILLTGGAGSGKTSLAGRLFSKTAFVVADLNFRSGLDYWKRVSCIDNITGFVTPTIDESNKPVACNLQYSRLLKLYDELIKDPAVDCIASDSVTFFEDIIKAKICSASRPEMIKLTNYDMWGLYLMTWKSIIIDLRQSGKKIIFTAHETKEKDDSDMIFKYQIAVDGQIRSKFPAIFSDVWRCEVQEVNQKHQWMARTLSNVRHEYLKNTYNLPGMLTQDDLVKHMQSLPK